jgi:predicted component of type VI protein secretion system
MKADALAKERHKPTLADCAARAKLWQEYVATYQKVLAESPEAFSAEFRERYLRATLDQ